MTPTLASAPLTVDIIEEAIANLPIQGRIILRLLLLQYLDVTQDEILFMVADRPDPRCVSGKKPVTTMTQESIMAMVDHSRDNFTKLLMEVAKAGAEGAVLAAEGEVIRVPAATVVSHGPGWATVEDVGPLLPADAATNTPASAAKRNATSG